MSLGSRSPSPFVPYKRMSRLDRDSPIPSYREEGADRHPPTHSTSPSGLPMLVRSTPLQKNLANSPARFSVTEHLPDCSPRTRSSMSLHPRRNPDNDRPPRPASVTEGALASSPTNSKKYGSTSRLLDSPSPPHERTSSPSKGVNFALNSQKSFKRPEPHPVFAELKVPTPEAPRPVWSRSRKDLLSRSSSASSTPEDPTFFDPKIFLSREGSGRLSRSESPMLKQKSTRMFDSRFIGKDAAKKGSSGMTPSRNQPLPWGTGFSADWPTAIEVRESMHENDWISLMDDGDGDGATSGGDEGNNSESDEVMFPLDYSVGESMGGSSVPSRRPTRPNTREKVGFSDLVSELMRPKMVKLKLTRHSTVSKTMSGEEMRRSMSMASLQSVNTKIAALRAGELSDPAMIQELHHAEVVKWFLSKSMDPPMKSDLLGTGMFHYLESCSQYGTVPISRIMLGLRTDKLCLEGMKLGDKGLFALMEALKENSYVGTVHLRNNGFGEKAGLSIADMLESNDSVTFLDISENPIGHAMVRIGEVVGKRRRVVTLLARGCGLRDKDISTLAHALGERLSVIERLDLAKNRIGDVGMKEIANALTTSTAIKDLDISYNQMRLAGAESIGRALCENRSLQHANLSWNGLGSEGGKLVGLALAEEGCMLKTIHLEQCGIDSQGVVMIAQGMEKNTRLESIDLRSNFIGDDGARAVFKALGVNRSITSFDLRGCNMQDDGRTMFDDANPTGSYKLNLANVYDRHVASRLQELEAEDVGVNWRNVILDGKPLNIKDITVWTLPTQGTLELDYKSGKRPPPNVKELDPEDLESLTAQLKHANLTDFDRVNMLRMAASVQFYSATQCTHILRTFNDSSPVRQSKIHAFLTLFGRIIDRKNLLTIMHEFNKREILEIQKSLGDLMSFSPENPSGRYTLDLAVDYENSFATMLFDMSASEEGGTMLFKGFEDAPVANFQFGVRRCLLDGQPFRYDPRSELPTDGILEIEYLSGRAPDPEKTGVLEEDVVDFIQQALEEGTQNEHELRKLVEMKIDEKAVTADVGKSLIRLFKDESNKVRLAQKMYPRLLNRSKTLNSLFEAVDKSTQIQMADALGNINTLTDRPFRHWRLDLSNQFDHRCASKLFTMAVDMEGDNILDLTLNGQGFRYSEKNSAFELPHFGILEFNFVDGTVVKRPNFGLASGQKTMTFLTDKSGGDAGDVSSEEED